MLRILNLVPLLIIVRLNSVSCKEWGTYNEGPKFSISYDDDMEMFKFETTIKEKTSFAIALNESLIDSDMIAFIAEDEGKAVDLYSLDSDLKPTTDLFANLKNVTIEKVADTNSLKFVAFRDGNSRDPFRDIIIGCGDEMTWTWLYNSNSTKIMNWEK